jgi:hypothetical protein
MLKCSPRMIPTILTLFYFAVAFPAPVHGAAPDLKIVSLKAPKSVDAGSSVDVTVTVENGGSADAAPSFLKIFLSEDLLLDGLDEQLGGYAVPFLAAGASHSATTTITIPLATPMGEHYILVQADANGDVAESKEANNVKGALIGIGPGPDLAAWIFAPETACAGDDITVTDKTRNVGNQPAPASTTYFFLSTNKKFDSGDLFLGARPVPPLPPGGFDLGSIVVTLPADLAFGTYYLFAIADGEGVVTEIFESNNAEHSKVTVSCGPEICGDGIDNDGDGLIDEGCVEICNDGIDNDGDGLIDEDCPQEVCNDGIDNDGDGLIDENCPPPTNPGTGTPGYWMTHPSAWPVDVITIGGIEYSKADAIAFMSASGDGDMTYTLFAALVSAKLNVLIGNDGTCVGVTIMDADAWMSAHPVGSGVHAGGDTSPWRIGEPLYERLDEYNNGRLCAPPRE